MVLNQNHMNKTRGNPEMIRANRLHSHERESGHLREALIEEQSKVRAKCKVGKGKPGMGLSKLTGD